MSTNKLEESALSELLTGLADLERDIAERTITATVETVKVRDLALSLSLSLSFYLFSRLPLSLTV